MTLHAMAVALGLGIWTALQPCPMATNLAAVSYLARRMASPRRVLLAGLLYAAGRAVAYCVLATLLLSGMVTSWRASTFLQENVVLAVGPLLILTAMVLLEMVHVRLPGAGWALSVFSRRTGHAEGKNPFRPEKSTVPINGKEAAGDWGVAAALLLGIVLALAFCPVSAACFFVSLLAMLAASDSRVVLPTIYALGTAAPVVVFAVFFALGTRSVGTAFNRLRQIEWWVRRMAALVLLVLGLHFSLKHNFQVVPFWNPWLGRLQSAWSGFVHLLHQ